MIAHITGTILHVTEKTIIVETLEKLGYELYVPSYVIGGSLAHKEISLWTTMIVRDNSVELFGFENLQERLVFNQLINISGVGPRSAVNILSIAPLSTLLQSISNKDASLLTKVSGIGKKTAQKIVLELGDKIEKLFPEHASSSESLPLFSSEHTELFEALESLGYTAADIRKKLSNVDVTGLSTDEALRKVLRSS